jgi:hypothetical protein
MAVVETSDTPSCSTSLVAFVPSKVPRFFGHGEGPLIGQFAGSGPPGFWIVASVTGLVNVPVPPSGRSLAVCAVKTTLLALGTVDA